MKKNRIRLLNALFIVLCSLSIIATNIGANTDMWNFHFLGDTDIVFKHVTSNRLSE